MNNLSKLVYLENEDFKTNPLLFPLMKEDEIRLVYHDNINCNSISAASYVSSIATKGLREGNSNGEFEFGE